jgi:hypothetical protein
MIGLTRDARHRYYLDDRGPIPSVTTITGILDKPALTWWKQEQVAIAAIEDAEMLMVMRDRGDTEAAAKYLLTKRDASDAARERGTDIHALAERWHKGEAVEPPDDLADEWEGYLRWWGAARPDVLYAEEMVCNVEHDYAGTFDLIAVFDGEAWMLDIKSSKSVADNRGNVWPEYRLQLAAYARAEFMWSSAAEERVALPVIDRYGIVHVERTGTRLVPAAVTEADWLAFLHCRALYAWKREKAA